MAKEISFKQKVNPKHTALIVVDVQNDFVHSEGALAKVAKRAGFDMSMIQEMVPRLVKFIEEARKVKLPIIYVKGVNSRWDKSEVWTEVRGNESIVEEGSWGAEFYEGISPREDERIVLKHRYSTFIGTNLDLILRSLGIKTVIMTGVATNICVESTARDAFQRDYRVVFVSDLTATFSEQAHEATLFNISIAFGTVVSTKELISAWSSMTK